MKNQIVFLAACVLLSGRQLIAQCSDAGVCSIGHETTSPGPRVSVDYQFGRSSRTDDLTFHSVVVSADIPVFTDSRLYASIPYSRQSGPLGSASGIGDMTLIWTQRLLGDAASRLGIQMGGKIALADVNTNGLPQAYQSGLGTHDGLFGVTYDVLEWNFALAYQLSRGRSSNSVNRLRRCDDLLLRAGYRHEFTSVTLGGEVLAIKRLAQSSVLTSGSGQPEAFGDLSNSDQTQINVLVRGSYALSETVDLKGMAAIPLLKRDVNVDGLTRSVSLSLGLSLLL